MAYWQARYIEYVEAENSPAVKKFRGRKKSAKQRGKERGLTVEEGGKG